MSIQTLHTRHVEVWQALWTTGFGISHSYADNAINGAQVSIVQRVAAFSNPLVGWGQALSTRLSNSFTDVFMHTLRTICVASLTEVHKTAV